MKILDTPRSGSVAGVTASRNRFGQYYRSRAIPVQPRTPKQTFNRTLLTAQSSAWRTLTDADRTLWNDYAAQISRSGSLGSTYQPTGAMLFAGQAALAAGPGLVSTPPTTLPTYVMAIYTMAYTPASPGPEAMTFTVGETSANNAILVETSGPVSAGITSAAAVRRWRTLPASALNQAANQFLFGSSPVSILTNWKYLFPSPSTGQVIWFRFQEIFFDGSTPAGMVNRVKQTFRLVIA